MSIRAELEVPHQRTAAEATRVKVFVHTDDYRTYISHQMDMGEAVQLLNDLTKALQTHREALNARMEEAAAELGKHVHDPDPLDLVRQADEMAAG